MELCLSKQIRFRYGRIKLCVTLGFGKLWVVVNWYLGPSSRSFVLSSNVLEHFGPQCVQTYVSYIGKTPAQCCSQLKINIASWQVAVLRLNVRFSCGLVFFKAKLVKRSAGFSLIYTQKKKK